MKRIFFPAVFFFMVVGNASAADEKLRLEHFKCYDVLKAGSDLAASATLKDQFHENNPQPKKVGPSVGFCNPVTKYHTGKKFPIQNIDHHLTVYPIYPQIGKPLKVFIANQFGKQKLHVYKSVALMVPTHKVFIDDHDTEHLLPEGLDHFQCYSARGKVVHDRVVLTDQFFEKTLHSVLEPFLFCNPVEKLRKLTDADGTVFDEVTEISNQKAHLTCYRTHQEEMPSVSVGIRNQFEGNKLALGDTAALCVPTQKIGWKPIHFKPIPFPFPLENR